MSFWSENVPAGTRLLSGPVICSFSKDPSFECAGYARANALTLPVAFTRDEFLSYGLWFERTACPPIDTRQVVQVTRSGATFTLRLADGEVVSADRVAIATGLKPFTSVPRQFQGLRKPLALHTSDLSDLTRFAGRDLVVIGAGQSAIDSAALLSEAGANVELLSRSPVIRWRGAFAPAQTSAPASPNGRRSLRKRALDVFNNPALYRLLPGPVRRWGLNRVLLPAGDSMRQARLKNVRVTLGRAAVEATEASGKVRLQIDDGSVRNADHVILGTGYTVDVDALTFLAPELRRQIRRRAGFPTLNRRMESSVPGLYFLGAAAARSFGPAMWIVRGSVWAAEAVSSSILDVRDALRESQSGVLAASGE